MKLNSGFSDKGIRRLYFISFMQQIYRSSSHKNSARILDGWNTRNDGPRFELLCSVNCVVVNDGDHVSFVLVATISILWTDGKTALSMQGIYESEGFITTHLGPVLKKDRYNILSFVPLRIKPLANDFLGEMFDLR